MKILDTFEAFLKRILFKGNKYIVLLYVKRLNKQINKFKKDQIRNKGSIEELDEAINRLITTRFLIESIKEN
jgi:hypothetical protein